jgi:predicted aminopeptidase
MIWQDDVEVVATVIHELCHATIYVRDDTAFNESMATFVGFAGALQYLRDAHGEDSRQVKLSRALLEERKAFSRIIVDLEEDLEALYAEDVPFEEKMKRRGDLFAASQGRVRGEAFRTGSFDFYADLEMNNAVFLSLLFYNTRIEFFEDVFHEQGGDLGRTIDHFRTATEELVARWKAQETQAPRDPEADVPVSGQ